MDIDDFEILGPHTGNERFAIDQSQVRTSQIFEGDTANGPGGTVQIEDAKIEFGRSQASDRWGNYMGQDFGMVSDIGESELTLKELVEDLNGEWGERLTTLQIQES